MKFIQFPDNLIDISKISRVTRKERTIYIETSGAPFKIDYVKTEEAENSFEKIVAFIPNSEVLLRLTK